MRSYMLDMYTQNRYNTTMINSFADKETAKIYNQTFSRKLPQDIQKVALRKLIMMDNAESLEDLRVPPANHLERLSGDREGQYSIRVNDAYRICFECSEKGFENLEIVDELNEEYQMNVQEQSYMTIKKNLEKQNLTIDHEEVLEDNSIMLTINL